MRLTKLSLSGFKSFARTTTFEFPAAASAIVGPNGSGKSNVAEAIRWVLGEQSMKALRGRKGEDLIFNGSVSAPRMGKASVALTFDNHDRAIPIDFDEAVLERKIFRDGTNEYYLNGSQVRLKDIVELLARMGLGETKHNIIGQGEVDRILGASPRERRELLEEAMGLRLYQLRRRDAERKLEETSGNVAQVALLLKEISPHLKFLKSQADKAERREVVRKELEDYYRAHVSAESAALMSEAERIGAEATPARARLKELEREIGKLRESLAATKTASGSAEAIRSREAELTALESKRRELERELGRIEGRLESIGRIPSAGRRTVEIAEIERALTPLVDELRVAADTADLKGAREVVRRIAEKIETFVAGIKNPGNEPGKTPGGADLAAEGERIRQALDGLDHDLARLRNDLATNIQDVRKKETRLRENFERLHTSEEEANGLRVTIQRIGFDEERLALRTRDLERIIEESGLDRRGLAAAGASPFGALPAEELKKKIEKLRVRLEEIGGIDQTVLKEYEDTRTRHDFLGRELADLAAAEKDLRKLITELEDRIERDFKTGFAKVRDEFHHYFKIIFGGGKGVLTYAAVRHATHGLEYAGGDTDETATEYGILIDVDLPRKRVTGLAMLSGGEKALVSIALLFAITAVSPPPFLVLDETDAALDEANSQKYGAILKELSARTQLILITHNRETMQQAGILYGVTMGEDGISKILSLKLEKAESYGNR